jgi:uncharacterized protein (DUF342 family)
LEAHLLLAPPRRDPGGYPEPPEAGLPTFAELELILREQGVQGEIDRGALKSALSVAAFGAEADVVAARGTPPEPGRDGYLELLVDAGETPGGETPGGETPGGETPGSDSSWSGAQPASGDRGAVDFKSTRLIRNVAEGATLALVHAPTPGKPGRDVLGRPMPARPGKALAPKPGPNTRRSDQDPNLIVAATAGHVRLSRGIPEVQECFIVAGDVDYSSGNVSFGKSVLIEGDVKSGFSVDAGGDVEIRGLAEDCRVTAKGKLLIRGGFTGGGRGVAQAKGEIRLGYLRNQEVRGESDVLVAGEAVNGKLLARKRAMVEGLVAGGKIQARQAVECLVAGTEKGAITHLEAGFDYGLAEKLEELRGQMDRLGKHARKIEEGLRQVQDLERLNRGLERWVIELVFEMERMRSKVDAKMNQLTERFAALDKQAAVPADARVVVRRMAYPGVVIKIGRETLRLEQPIAGPKTFYARDGRILIG